MIKELIRLNKIDDTELQTKRFYEAFSLSDLIALAVRLHEQDKKL